MQTRTQAAQSSRVVRLVSFGAAATLVGLLLWGAVSLRYAPLWRDGEPPVAVLAALEPPPAPPPQAPRREPRPETPDAPLALATGPQAEPAANEPVLITQPIWVSRPRNLARFYPRDAFMRGLNGQVVLDCIVETTGQLDCTIESETPVSQGFGEAALAIAAAHVMQPATENGMPVRGRYRMIVPFTAR
jgi:TonB family protein